MHLLTKTFLKVSPFEVHRVGRVSPFELHMAFKNGKGHMYPATRRSYVLGAVYVQINPA